MEDRNQEQRMDELLDTALARYSRVEPRPEAIERALAAIREPRPLLWGGWIWLPVGAAAVLAVVLGVSLVEQPSQPQPVPRVAAVRPADPPTAPAQVVPATPAMQPPAAPPSRVASAAKAETPPRLSQFPSPAPLSEQERLLLRYLEQTPKDQIAIVQLGQGPIPKIRIEPLYIEPLGFEHNKPNPSWN